MAQLRRDPIRLTRLSIENFRGIDRLDLNLTDSQGVPLDTVVLAGANGCGKTTVLESIPIAVGMRQLLPEDVAPFSEQIRFGAEQCEVTATIQTIPPGPEPFIEKESWSLSQPLLKPGPSRSLRLVRPQIEYFSSRREPEALGETPSQKGRKSEREARRIVELKRRLVSAYFRRQQAERRGQIEMFGEEPFTRIQKVWDYLYGSSDQLEVIQVSNNPGSDWEVVLREAGKPIPLDVTSLAQARDLAPARSDIPRMVPLDRLSSGQVALFAFAGPLVFRDEPPEIVLVDEPEQHMHVLWQQLFVGLLRTIAPTAQLILATHSPEILRSVRSDQRFMLVPDSAFHATTSTSTAPSTEASS